MTPFLTIREIVLIKNTQNRSSLMGRSSLSIRSAITIIAVRLGRGLFSFYHSHFHPLPSLPSYPYSVSDTHGRQAILTSDQPVVLYKRTRKRTHGGCAGALQERSPRTVSCTLPTLTASRWNSGVSSAWQEQRNAGSGRNRDKPLNETVDWMGRS